jgi:uncharacterized protein YpiB (UPF0302 family)
MTTTEATAEVFLTAFRALKKKERAAVLERLMKEEQALEDLRYAAIVEERKREPRIALEDYLAEKARKRK